MPLNKPFEDLNEQDLIELIDRGEPESKTLDYKRDRIGDSTGERKEFLYDIASFANASGGHLLIGISEAQGKPIKITGLEGMDADQEVLRLEGMCRDGISRRIIPEVRMRAVPVQSAPGPVLAIRIPNSWTKPHMVTYRGTNKFYSRNSNGKYILDVDEIRSAFLFSEAAAEKIRQFRLDRIASINSGETPPGFPQNSTVVLHLVPWSFSHPQAQFDISKIEVEKLNLLEPVGIAGSRFNFDGRMAHLGNPPVIYVQFFRNGAIEIVDAYRLETEKGDSFIPSIAFEKDVLSRVKELVSVQQRLGVETPVVAMLTLLDVRGYSMGVSSSWPSTENTPIERDHLFVPEVFVESFDGNLHEVAKGLVDPVWHACGFEQTPNFAADDKDFRWSR